jgi:hypothetical protein
MLRLRVRRRVFSVDGQSLSGRVRRAPVVLLVRPDNVPGWLREPAGRCIRRVRSQVDRADRVVQDQDSQVVRGRALAHGRAVRVVRFRLRVRLRRARGRDNGRVSVAADNATRR